jgi:hypothetical protein
MSSDGPSLLGEFREVSLVFEMKLMTELSSHSADLLLVQILSSPRILIN